MEKVKASFDKPLEVGAGNLFTYNKELMRKENPIDLKTYQNKLGDIETYIGKKIINEDKKYFMLLGWEDRYFTVFNVSKKFTSGYNAARILEQCINNIGKVISIDYEEEEDCYEIWILQEGEPAYYRFFNYDFGVVEC